MTICMIFLKIILALSTAFLTLAIGSFLDIILRKAVLKECIWSAAGMMLIIGIQHIAGTLYSFIEKSMKQKSEIQLREQLFDKTADLPYINLEDEEVIALRDRVKNDPENKLVNGFSNQMQLVEYILRIVSLVYLIAVHVWWVSIMAFLIIMLLCVLMLQKGKENYEAFEEAEEYRRRADGLGNVLLKKEYVLEKNLFRYQDFIHQKWRGLYEKARVTEFHAQMKNFLGAARVNIMVSILALLLTVLLIFPVADGRMTAGIYMALIANLFLLMEQMSWNMSLTMQDFAEYSMYLKDFKK